MHQTIDRLDDFPDYTVPEDSQQTAKQLAARKQIAILPQRNQVVARS
jgi:hypothetical protein